MLMSVNMCVYMCICEKQNQKYIYYLYIVKCWMRKINLTKTLNRYNECRDDFFLTLGVEK